MKRMLLPADAIITAYFAALTVLTLASWGSLQHPWRFLGTHGLIVGAAWMTAWADARIATPKWRLLHYWFPVFAVLGAFRELHDFVPEVHPFSDRRFDHALAAVDARWFGDVRGFFRAMQWTPLTDAMHICYWSYFVIPIALAFVLWRRGELARFREVVSVLLVGWYVSYLAYVAVPAVGPHRAVDGVRDAALDGGLLGGPLHRALMRLEGEMPDAFPSGHALVAMLAIVLAWRHDRRAFAGILPLASGLVLATMYLRYHYAIDVAAGAALVPVTLLGGMLVNRAWTGTTSAPAAG